MARFRISVKPAPITSDSQSTLQSSSHGSPALPHLPSQATSENLRHYYGCGGEELEREPESGANNTTDTELLKRCQLEVTDLKAQSGKQVEQIAQLTIQLAEAKAEKTLPNSGVEDQLQGDQKEGAGGAAPSEVELLRVQVAALKEIVSIQDEGVVRKAQRGGSAGKEDDRGGESDSEPRNMFRLSDSLPKGNAAGCPAERDPSQADNGSPRMDSHERFRDEGTGGGIQFVKALLGRWRGEVYALVLKMKEREWEAVREAAKVGEELDRERGLREETNSRCKVRKPRPWGRWFGAKGSQVSFARKGREHESSTWTRLLLGRSQLISHSDSLVEKQLKPPPCEEPSRCPICQELIA